jgi:hypothetical protein
MKITLLGLDPSLTLSLPALQTLAQILDPTRVVCLHETDKIAPEITQVVLCATPGGATSVRKWLKEQRSLLAQLESVAFVEIADEDSPDSWLLDEQGWLDFPGGPLLGARIAADDRAAAADFALALKGEGVHAGRSIKVEDLRGEGQDSHRKNLGEEL